MCVLYSWWICSQIPISTVAVASGMQGMMCPAGLGCGCCGCCGIVAFWVWHHKPLGILMNLAFWVRARDRSTWRMMSKAFGNRNTQWIIRQYWTYGNPIIQNRCWYEPGWLNSTSTPENAVNNNYWTWISSSSLNSKPEEQQLLHMISKLNQNSKRCEQGSRKPHHISCTHK